MIEELLGTIDPPTMLVAVASAEEWRQAEDDLGITFPDDLKEINRLYGLGWFDDFIILFSPSEQAGIFRVNDYTTDETITLAQLRRQEQESHKVETFASRLIPVGETQNGDELYYVVRTPGVTSDIVLAETRAGGLMLHHGDISSLLAGLFSQSPTQSH